MEDMKEISISHYFFVKKITPLNSSLDLLKTEEKERFCRKDVKPNFSEPQ